MKHDVVQSFAATVAHDGREIEVECCCGPALLLLQGQILRYVSTSVESPGRCCHARLELVRQP